MPSSPPPATPARLCINRIKAHYRGAPRPRVGKDGAGEEPPRGLFLHSGQIRDLLVTDGLMSYDEAWGSERALKAGAKRAVQLDCTARYELARDEGILVTPPVPFNRYRRSSIDSPYEVRRARIARLRHSVTRIETDLVYARAQAAETGARRDIRAEYQLEAALSNAQAALVELLNEP